MKAISRQEKSSLLSNSYKDIRKQVVEQRILEAEQSGQLANPRITNGRKAKPLTIPQYQNLMSKDGEWGADEEAIAWAKLTGANLYITRADDEGRPFTYLAYEHSAASENSRFYHLVNMSENHWEPYGKTARGDGNCLFHSLSSETQRVNQKEEVRVENTAHLKLVPSYRNELQLRDFVVNKQFIAMPVYKLTKKDRSLYHREYGTLFNKKFHANYQVQDTARKNKAIEILKTYDLEKLCVLYRKAQKADSSFLPNKLRNLNSEWARHLGPGHEKTFSNLVNGKITLNQLPEAIRVGYRQDLQRDLIEALAVEVYRNDKTRNPKEFDKLLGIALRQQAVTLRV